VQLEIHNFGGDAASVAIFGQSSGAGCVELLTRSPLSKGACGRGTVSDATAAATTRIATARETVPRVRLLDKGSRHSAHGLRLHASAAFVPDRSLPRCDQPVRRLERQTTAVCTCDDRRTREAPELLCAYALQCAYDNGASPCVHCCERLGRFDRIAPSGAWPLWAGGYASAYDCLRAVDADEIIFAQAHCGSAQLFGRMNTPQSQCSSQRIVRVVASRGWSPWCAPMRENRQAAH
jgi:hypothetical protein